MAPLLDDVALGAAERIEAALGPSAGLTAFRSVAQGLAPGPGRVRATLGALRCAARVSGASEVEALAPWLATAGEGDAWREVVALCEQLVAADRPALAAIVASAEARREPTARTEYLVARCLAAATSRDRALDAFAHACEQAERAGDAPTARAARLGRIELLLADDQSAPRAAAEAAHLDVAELRPDQRIVVAAARLWSPGRYARVAALDELASVAERASVPTGSQVARVVAAHVDRMGWALTAIELDRARTILTRAAEPPVRARVVARLAQVAEMLGSADAKGGAAPEPEREPDPARAHALDAARAALGGAPPPVDASPSVEAIAALRAGDFGRATAATERTTAEVRASGAREAAAWALAALALDRSPTRAAACTLVEALLDARGPVPRRGLTELADALTAAGRDALAIRTLCAAGRAGHGQGDVALTDRLLAAAWRAYARGDLAAARDALDRARIAA